MKKAGNCLIYIAILTIINFGFLSNIVNPDNRIQDLSSIKQSYQALKITSLLQIILLFIAGWSLKNDNTIIRRISKTIVK